MAEEEQKKIRTKDIDASIHKFARENKLSPADVDFTIHEIETYYKDIRQEEFTHLSANPKDAYISRSKIINEHLQLKQLYIISLYKKIPKAVNLNYEIEYGDSNITPKMIVKKDSQIFYKERAAKEIYRELLEEVNKIKAKNKIIVNLFDEKMIRSLKVFTKYIYKNRFTKNVKIPLFEGIGAELSREAKLIMWFEHKPHDAQIIEVNKDEVLVEFRKPKYGKNGFNAFGQTIQSGYGSKADDLETNIDTNSIYIKEDDDKKLYISKKKGFVQFNENLFAVKNKINIDKISRVQEHVSSDEKNNIEVHVSQNDISRDSIGAGVELASETIHINGHIGENSILEATTLQIDGATHKSSKQFAKIAKINRHKGTLRCNKAEITLLEGGVVHATQVYIESALGGEVRAQDVTIGQVKNNLKVYASHSITINRVSGEDNTFKIDYKDIPTLTSRLHYLDQELEDWKYELDEAKINASEKIPSIKEEIEQIRQIRESLINSAKTAKISIEKPLGGFNNIIFSIDKNHHIHFKTEARKYEPFYLIIGEDTIKLHPTTKYITI